MPSVVYPERKRKLFSRPKGINAVMATLLPALHCTATIQASLWVRDMHDMAQVSPEEYWQLHRERDGGKGMLWESGDFISMSKHTATV